ncbi:MAG: MFS transporter, partial [Candidatus Puniceispirillaceae bacterium]
GGVCLAALHFSFVQSVMMLIIGIYFLRLSGQGMMYHVYSTAVTRRYLQVRGRALAISGFGMNAAEALFPIVVVLGLGVFDWRLIWIMLPVFAFISFAPAITYLTRRTDFQDGPGREADTSPGRQKIKTAPHPCGAHGL